MSMNVKNSQLVSDLPLSVSGQREGYATSTAVDQRKKLDSRVPQQEGATEITNRLQAETGLDKLAETVEQVNKQIKSNELKFEVVQELGVTVVKVIDTKNDKVVRQIPSEEAVKRLEDIKKFLDQSVYHQDNTGLKESITGLIFNQTL